MGTDFDTGRQMEMITFNCTREVEVCGEIVETLEFAGVTSGVTGYVLDMAHYCRTHEELPKDPTLRGPDVSHLVDLLEQTPLFVDDEAKRMFAGSLVQSVKAARDKKEADRRTNASLHPVAA